MEILPNPRKVKCTRVEPGFCFSVGIEYTVVERMIIGGHVIIHIVNDLGNLDCACLTCQIHASWEIIE
jgi:hypothetical protein